MENNYREKQTVVIGLGNPLLTDEGIGVHLLHELTKTAIAQEGNVSFMDLGTSGMGVLHAIAGKNKAIFIDCALMGERPGTIRRFTPKDVETSKEIKGFSLHEGDLLKILDLSSHLGECPEEVIIFGIEPQDLSTGRELSTILGSRIKEYMEQIIAELANQ